MPDDLIVKETARWLRYAIEDLDSAIILQSSVPRHSCLLAQQSGEKAIKSIYVYANQQFPKSHDLDMLRNLLLGNWEVKNLFTNLSGLSFWAVESRYPGNTPDATVQDADDAISLTRNIVSCVENDLIKNGFTW